MVKIEEVKENPTLCLNMIVKNESKIIERLLESVINIIDTYCICDTGSTDNTIELIETFFKNRNIPGRIVIEPFKNFEHNRTHALKSCYGMSDYILLLDADMILQVNNFNKSAVLNSGDVFTILQGTPYFYYKNVRIVKNIENIKYIGVTHEYLSTPNELRKMDIKKEELFIKDVGDGGAKSDKLERDIRLLTEGIKNEPKNGRYYFYLANTYKENKQYEKAIETYLAKIDLGGWNQEIWQSFYKIGHCYKDLKNDHMAIDHYKKCSEIIPERLENRYQIINLYRNKGENKKAYEMYQEANKYLIKHLKKEIDRDDYLFLENDIYIYKLIYEYTIIAYYNNIRNIDTEVIGVMNNCPDGNIINNLLGNYKFYASKLESTKNINISATFNYKDFLMKSSSTSLLYDKENEQYYGNMRFVNYTINKDGTYLGCNKHVLTINKKIRLDSNFNILSEETIYPHKTDYYMGYEDVRLYFFNNKLYFTGISKQITNKIGVSFGEYELLNNIIFATEYSQTFKNTECEKNWSLLEYENKLCVIYSYNPLIICTFNDKKRELEILKINTNMPMLFKHARGSSNGVLYENEYYFIIHFVSYTQPRNYYHLLCVFDINMNLLRYSNIFKFSDLQIEYCLSLIIHDNNIIIPYSTFDSTTNIGIYSLEYINSLLIYKNNT